MSTSELIFIFLISIQALSGCATGGSGIKGNEAGSSPSNASEEREYKRAILRCYKTGGNRIVKIKGKLMCY